MNGFFGKLEVLKKQWILIVLGVIAIGSLVFDLYLFFSRPNLPQGAFSPNLNLSAISQNYCSSACTDQINLALKSQKKDIPSAVESIVSISPSPTPILIPTSSPTPVPAKTVKEFFVPLGVGTGKSADWTIVDGIGAKVDPADYGNIKQVTFEITAFVPTGNQTIWIRLYNANTYQTVAGSELTLSGGTATLLVSSPISLPSGNNLYQIQMKTQLQYPVNINMARLRIKII